MEITKIETNFKRELFWNTNKMNFTGTLKNLEKGLINIYPDTIFQKIIGFGGAFTEASGYCISQVNSQIANSILEDYFSFDGLNYSFCRIPVASCDFSLSSYSYLKNSDINTFSIEKDKKYIIPFIKNALNKNPNIKFLASPWSPPKFMKSNNKLSLGGKLLKEYYYLYAKYLVKFILSYQELGINIDYITIQNEPNATQSWESCIYSAEEEADFAKNYLYPEFTKNNIQTKIIAWDHNKERLYIRSKETFKIANDEISGMAMHWYSGDYFEEIELTRYTYPEKLLFHTEGCTGFSKFRQEDEIYNAEIYGHNILGNLNAGINGYIDWNILLDSKGGPNHKRNYCNSPVMLNSENIFENLLRIMVV